MENIFENAKFGDRFLTRDGRVALYIQPIHRAFTYHNLISILRSGTCNQEYLENGKVINSCEANDIITRLENPSLQDIEELQKKFEECKETVKFLVNKYCKPIDEKKLNELVENENPYKRCTSIPYMEWEKGFKAGYYKAKEE